MFNDAEIREHLNNFDVGKVISTRFRRAIAEAGVSFGSEPKGDPHLDGMRIEAGYKHRATRWIPLWTANDSKLRRVLEMRDKKHSAYYHSLTVEQVKGIPLDQLIRMGRHEQTVTAAGSFAALQAAIAYRSWREGWHANHVAESLGVTAIMVRQTLFRIRYFARLLGFEKDEQRHWSAGKPRPLIARRRKAAEYHERKIRLHLTPGYCGYCRQRKALPDRTRCRVCTDVNRTKRSARGLRRRSRR